MPLLALLRRLRSWIVKLLLLLAMLLFLGASTVASGDPLERVRRFTRQQEFEYVGWTLDALLFKLSAFSVGAAGYLPEPDRQDLVRSYAELIVEAGQLEARLAEIYGDPLADDPMASAAVTERQLDEARDRLRQLLPLVETVVQDQVAVALQDLGLDAAGAILPPVAFHFTQLPMGFIVSPRRVIQQDANLSLNAGLTIEEQVRLESEVESSLDVSTLVVPIGGVGIYPTMVLESGSLTWVFDTVAHEWVHNYLTLRPLGLNYETSPELRTMNETTASILGGEIGRMVLERYYPDLLPPPPAPEAQAPPAPSPEPPRFDFRAEMHETRLQVDRLLAEGEIEEAEAYMEARRQVFWENGYRIRRINQAYFAFYGAYADQPGGAAGEDPVGAAVRELRRRIASPAEFLQTIAWMSDYSDLQTALARVPTTP
ncbi:MAG TPA: hypothetical protein VJ123_11135 [Anaerolineales bacterium]|nr:hypothetical protein [Anaerolineales bacterium]